METFLSSERERSVRERLRMKERRSGILEREREREIT